MNKKKKIYDTDRDFLKEMLSQKFYNEHRIPSYNHVTGKLDRMYISQTRETKEHDIDLKTLLLCQ